MEIIRQFIFSLCSTYEASPQSKRKRKYREYSIESREASSSSRAREEEREKERERETLEDGWPATIFLTRGERFDRRMAEGGSFSIPAPGVFARLRYLSSLFHPVLAPFVTPFCNFPHLPPIVSGLAAFCKTSLGPPSSRLN